MKQNKDSDYAKLNLGFVERYMKLATGYGIEEGVEAAR